MSNRSGQSLILALLIMFLLVFIGGLFVTLIARNVHRAQRSTEVLTAEYLSEAGIKYVDDQLTYSSDGADWRPLPNYPEIVKYISQYPNATPQEIADEMVNIGGRLPNPNDPDYFYFLRGFSRYSYGKGRFLIRVTYNPQPNVPASKFIKIESVGRVGEIIEDDPTTWGTSQPMRARREKVAYKAIGITDYARFITNKDRRPGGIALGTPGFVTNYGEFRDDGNGNVDLGEAFGGSVRVNGDLTWYGKNLIWLDPLRGDNVEVAGEIRHDQYEDMWDANNWPDDVTKVLVNKYIARPSATTKFDTIALNPNTGQQDPVSGISTYRDGSMEPDQSGKHRAIFRLDPPLIDAGGTGDDVGRYRNLTRNSGEWKRDANGDWYNTGYYGWGEGIYVSNTDDIQTEDSVYTLRGDWTNPGSSEYWRGPYYTPPAVSIILTGTDLDNADGDNDPNTGDPDLIMTHDSGPEQARFIWRDKDGNLLTDKGEQSVMPYPRNGIIFTEGNIRIKGTLPENKQLTVVSGGTIYIEGNILKHRDANGNIDSSGAIALLATDNICVNTTQFFSPVRGVFQPGNQSGHEPHFEVSPGIEGAFWIDFAFGKTPDAEPSLYVRHTSSGDTSGWSYMNMLVNRWSTGGPDPWFGVYNFGNNPAWPYAYPLESTKDPMWTNDVFSLIPGRDAGGYDFYDQPGVYNRFGFQFDESIPDPTITKVNYLVSRVAVQPCDIYIEALVYAQNGSFFVMPGEWFNPDENDYEGAPDGRPQYVNPKYPFYGQPMDIKIVVNGAVSENLPASVSDVKAWMDKWGWIPDKHGSDLSEPTTGYRNPLNPDDPNDIRRQGLTMVYDSHMAYPWRPSDPADASSQLVPIRVDGYGRLLPITPCLPTSPQTLYFGEPS